MDTKPHIRYKLTKDERLCSEKIIAGLFQPGFFVSKYPLRINFIALPVDEMQPGLPLQVLFSVSKRRFKRAVDRNRVKRLLREVYRLNKHELLEHLSAKGLKLAIAIVYTGKELPEYQKLTRSFLHCVAMIKEKTNVD
jgi:ribonuclease P protein component